MTVPISEYDVVFISYDEPNADENWAHLQSICPWAKRSHGVFGSDACHKAAAKLSETERFIGIDADNKVREDFFELEDVDINNLNLADRINLYFKGGTHMIIDFTPEEKDLIKVVGDCETFDDTLKASELLYKYCQDEKDRKDSEELEQSSDIKLKGETGSEKEDYGDLEDLSEGLGKGKGEQDKQEGQDEIEETPDQLIIDPTQPWDKHSQGKGPATGSDDIEAMTDEIFNEKVSELNDPKMNGTRDNLYAQLPQVDLNKVIISNEQVNKELHDHFCLLYTSPSPRDS